MQVPPVSGLAHHGLPLGVLGVPENLTERVAGRDDGQPTVAGKTIDAHKRMTDVENDPAGRKIDLVVSSFVGKDQIRGDEHY